ncbi:TLD-domain-containing protein [Pilobolus umbonatus]|nr:TLD-domain-containing protein [Pilobolus umbonatus]
MGNSTSQPKSQWTPEEDHLLHNPHSPPAYYSTLLFTTLTHLPLDTLYTVIKQFDPQPVFEATSVDLREFISLVIQSSLPAWYGSDFAENTEDLSLLTDYFIREGGLQCPGFGVLFRLCIHTLYPLTTHDTHQLRLLHLQAPHHTRLSDLLTPYSYFLLTLSLPPSSISSTTTPVHHHLLYSSKKGASWQLFVDTILHRGSTWILIKTKRGEVFGMYADTPWAQHTSWYGTPSNYLFQIHPAYNTYSASTMNDHYQYLCWGKKSLVNGIGMGGQLEYCGVWVEDDFIHGYSRPGSTTFSNPSFCKQDRFEIDEVEVWLLREVEKEEGEDHQGVFTRQQEMEFMELAGKKMYSKDLPSPASDT